ncbi:hypothetical protein NUU61_005431 [Penicillium alfredii]|uniref:Uncharacterized protein n=1 Tax=Penicillium alfredii TaxID=1506179 RepID=A0A9W9K7U1_9EURO|nr:uncharacterized protein NUU61_005431 [Penicillium alfredii]KAJ5096075.1 hypothetical protein NUU61_005431 [Penicillium alfredii]
MGSFSDSVYFNCSRDQKSEADAALSNTDRQEGVLTDAKHHEKANGIKETVLDGAVPAAQGALQTVQGQVRAMTGKGGNETPHDAGALPSDEIECIDQMDTERVCDFLREKHTSTAPPPSTN